MQKGMNSDVIYKGETYHLQTEDWGTTKAAIVTRVFRGGAVVKSVQTAYTEVLSPSQRRDPKAIRLAVHEQHQQILDLLLSGQLIR